MRGHLQCRDTLAGNEGCPLKTGTTVLSPFPTLWVLCTEWYYVPETSYDMFLTDHHMATSYGKTSPVTSSKKD